MKVTILIYLEQFIVSCKSNHTLEPKGICINLQIPFLDFYYFLLVIEYTGIPINVIIIPPKAINVAVNN